MKLSDWIELIEDFYIRNESKDTFLDKEINEIYQVFKDWSIDNEPNYVELIELLIERHIIINFCINNFQIYFLRYWFPFNYIQTKTIKDNYIYGENLGILFKDIIESINLFNIIHKIYT